MLRGEREFLDAIDRLETVFNAEGGKYAEEIKRSYVEQIVAVGAVDRGWYRDSIAWREQVEDEGSRFFIDSGRDPFVFYEGFVEFDTNQRVRGGGTQLREGRYPARRGILFADIEGVSNELVDEAFTR